MTGKQNPSEIVDFRGILVRVVRLERTVSWSQTRRDTNFAIPGYSISAMIPRRTVKIKFFLSVVIPVVKATFMPFPATGKKPAIARVARLCGISPCPVPDTATALPNQARYQLRYTRIFGFAGHLLCGPIRIVSPDITAIRQKNEQSPYLCQELCIWDNT